MNKLVCIIRDKTHKIKTQKRTTCVCQIGDPITGMLLGGYIDAYKQTQLDVIKSILLSTSKHNNLDTLIKQPDLHNHVFIFDRGYFLIEMIDIVTACGARTWGSAKRGASLPVTYGDSKPRPHQMYIAKKGSNEMFLNEIYVYFVPNHNSPLWGS